MQSNLLSKTYHSGGYLRLSHSDIAASGDTNAANQEAMQSNSIENQKEYIEEFLKTKPEIISTTFYVDDGYSGVNFERPSFQRMLQDIRENKIDCVIVKDLSRFGRNYIEVGKYIEQLFPLLGVRFIAINDNYDSAEDRANNNIILPFKNLINDAYCRDISVKIRSHLDVKRRRGEFIGAFPVYGYKRGEEKNKLVIDPYAAEIVKEIFCMKMEGMSNQAIADELNSLGVLSPAEYKKEQGSGYKAMLQTHEKAKWSVPAVIRILSDEVYVGTLIQGKESTPNYKIKMREKKPREEWIRVEGTHEAIISPADFEIVADILKKDTRVSTGKKSVSLYSGYLYCADCGCSMVRKCVRSGQMPYTYYICSGNKKDKTTCSSHSISERTLDEAVTKTIRMHIKYLCGLQESMESVREALNNSDKTKTFCLQFEKRQEVMEKDKKLQFACYEDYKNGLITQDEYKIFKASLESREEAAESAIRELEKKKQLLLQGGMEKEAWMRDFVENEKAQLTRSLLVRLVDRIYVYENHRIEILFRYQDEMEKAPEALEDFRSCIGQKGGQNGKEIQK